MAQNELRPNPQDHGPSFRDVVNNPIPQEREQYLRDEYTLWYQEHKARAESMAQQDERKAQILGYWPVRRTVYDREGGIAEWEDESTFLEAMMDEYFYTNVLVHPDLLRHYRTIEREESFAHVPKNVPVFDEMIGRFRAGNPKAFGTNMDAESAHEDYKESANELIQEAAHFAWLTPTRLINCDFGSSSSDTQSPPMLAQSAILGAPAFVSYDAEWSDPQAQLMVIDEAIQQIKDNIAIRNHPERDFIIKRAIRSLGVTVKLDPRNILQTLDPFIQRGVTLFRGYMPRSESGRAAGAISLAHTTFGDMVEIITGPIGGDVHFGADQDKTVQAHAQRLINAGAAGIGTGRADGGNCLTGIVTGAAPNNLWVLYRLAQMNLEVPIHSDAAGKEAIAYALGATVMKTRSLYGGTFAQQPYGMHFPLPYPCKSMDGEASAPIKIRGGKVDGRGRPVFVEGDPDCIGVDYMNPSIAGRFFTGAQRVATGLIFARQPSIREYMAQENPVIWYMDAASSHGVTSYAVR